MPRIPIDWLAEHVEVPADLTPAQLAADLVKVGLEEEEIHPPALTGPIVVGKVLSLVKEPQKNGKLINYCRVDVGEHNDEPGTGKEPAEVASRGIICGAHNFEEGDYVVVSLPGAVLPGDFQISSRKTYGHISDGMICSESELGLGDSHDGILVLAKADDADAIAEIPAVGEDVIRYLGVPGETLEINVTPDRGYCFAMRGVAREYSHSTGAKFTDPAVEESLSQPLPEINNEGFAVEVDDDAPIHGVPGCDRFVTRIVRGVDPQAPSPKWMRDRLIAAGMRPISLAVDATNYVMLDLGQPLHAYDLDKTVAPIVVRRARAGETLVTLDDVERKLNVEDLVIADSMGGRGERVVGLAGTMGGAETEIGPETTDVLIEAAHFDQVSVARNSRRHRLPSEASKRFERGVDPKLAPIAAQRVAEILAEYGGGQIDSANFEHNTTVPPESCTVPVREVSRLTGLDISTEQIVKILESIGCAVVAEGENLEVTPPTWRPDLTGPAHYVEEVARLVGYDEIGSTLPPAPAGRGLTVAQRQRRDVARTLAEAGWVQVLSYPFVSPHVFDLQEIPDNDERRLAIRLQNPLQEEAPLMRTSILDSLLATARLNVARGNPAVAVFEAGMVTRPKGMQATTNPGAGKRPEEEQIQGLREALPAQPDHFAGVACGKVTLPTAGFPAVTWDWRDAVDAVLAAGRTIGAHVTARNATKAPFHPGRCAEMLVGETVIGYAGEIAPRVCAAFDLPERSIAFEFDADALFASRGVEPIAVAPVATFPPAKEDVALVVDSSLPAAEVAAVIREAAGDVLEELELFDVYTGDQIPENKKSLAFALRFRAADHTMKADETAEVRNRIVKETGKAFRAELRA